MLSATRKAGLTTSRVTNRAHGQHYGEKQERKTGLLRPKFRKARLMPRPKFANSEAIAVSSVGRN
jgi:hypothetical protein